MENILEVIDKTKRRIRLTEKQWRHIMKKHPSLTGYLKEIEETLKYPDKITSYSNDVNVRYYYKHFKNVKLNKYLLTIVKYLNGDGFVISVYFINKIK
ncbi:hypothetical protein J4466_03685 [Candidatus Pacearchaeota archaeon]|nr:hypothetical protein [Candidatus Pacearchaeota archaeon]